jgi:hypothetical protein
VLGADCDFVSWEADDAPGFTGLVDGTAACGPSTA